MILLCQHLTLNCNDISVFSSNWFDNQQMMAKQDLRFEFKMSLGEIYVRYCNGP